MQWIDDLSMMGFFRFRAMRKPVVGQIFGNGGMHRQVTLKVWRMKESIESPLGPKTPRKIPFLSNTHNALCLRGIYTEL